MIGRFASLFAAAVNFSSTESDGADENRDAATDEPVPEQGREAAVNDELGEANRSDENGTSMNQSAAIEALLERDVVPREEILHRTGLTEDAFLLELVHHFGGATWQGELVEQTGWPTSTVSRRLGKLQAEGRLNRCQIGREKIVYLPGQAPESLPIDREANPDDASPTAATDRNRTAEGRS